MQIAIMRLGLPAVPRLEKSERCRRRSVSQRLNKKRSRLASKFFSFFPEEFRKDVAHWTDFGSSGAHGKDRATPFNLQGCPERIGCKKKRTPLGGGPNCSQPQSILKPQSTIEIEQIHEIADCRTVLRCIGIALRHLRIGEIIAAPPRHGRQVPIRLDKF